MYKFVRESSKPMAVIAEQRTRMQTKKHHKKRIKSEKARRLLLAYLNVVDASEENEFWLLVSGHFTV